MTAATPSPGWDALAERIRACGTCTELAATRTSVVVGDAPSGARLVLLGEAPGAQEDEAGRPFVGRSGQYLDAALARAGLARDQVAVLNVLKCRPPANRAPKRAEVEACRPWLRAQIDMLDPLLILTLGLTAMHWALGRGPSLASVRETVQRFERWPLLATYHPAAALRVGGTGPAARALDADLSRAITLLDELSSRAGVR